MSEWLIFAPAATRPLAEQIAKHLNIACAPSEEREFDGGEHKMRPLCEVRSKSVAVVQSLRGDSHSSANDRLMRLLLFIGALRDAGAASITACIPYLCYARKDRRTQTHDPVSSRSVAAMFEAVGVDRVIVLEVHNEAAFDNAFRCETIRLEAAGVFKDVIRDLVRDRPFVLVSPDIGGIKRVQHLRTVLEAAGLVPSELCFLEKLRSAGVVSGEAWVGDATGREAIIYDDLIASGGTLLRATQAARQAGAIRVHAMAAHAAFTPETQQLFGPDGPDTITVTDSVPIADAYRAFQPERLRVCSVASLFAETLRRIETGASLAGLSRSG